MLGPHVLLSSYAGRVISCGTGVLSSFVTLPGLSLVLQNLIGAQWSFSGPTTCVFLFMNALFVLSSASARHFGYSMLCLSVALFPGAGVGCPLLSSQALWQRLRHLSFSSVCGLHFTGPTNARQSQWETVISCAGGQVFPGLLGLRIVSDASRSFLPQVVA